MDVSNQAEWDCHERGSETQQLALNTSIQVS